VRAKSAPATGALFLWRRSIAAVLRGRWTAIASENIVRKVRDDLFDQLMHLPVSYYDKAETGDLVQRCTSDVDTLRLFLAEHVEGRPLALPTMYGRHCSIICSVCPFHFMTRAR
jgi:ABC-type multidrug transport system fused ATPase/permease subunit